MYHIKVNQIICVPLFVPINYTEWWVIVIFWPNIFGHICLLHSPVPFTLQTVFILWHWLISPDRMLSGYYVNFPGNLFLFIPDGKDSIRPKKPIHLNPYWFTKFTGIICGKIEDSFVRNSNHTPMVTQAWPDT